MNRRSALGVLGALGASVVAQDSASAGNVHQPPGGLRGVFGGMTGAKAAVSALVQECVPCVFGIPGAQNNEFWDEMKSAGLPYLLVTNEASASVMADAAARVSGRPGVFCVVPGPGLTNAMTGIGEALLDSVPIVGLITDVARGPNAPSFQVHSLANTEILRPVTKAVFPVRHQGEIPGAIHEAFRVARCGEPGPTAVVIPYDLLVESWNYDQPPPVAIAPPFDEDAYRRALSILSNRRCKVGIYAGMGCHDAGAELAAAAEILQAPVATSVSGKGAISERHPLSVGWGYGPQGTRTAERIFEDVDVLLAVGVKYGEVSTANYSIPCHDPLIHVDANPANLGKNVHAKVKVLADAGVFLTRLLQDAPAVARRPDPSLQARIRGLREDEYRENVRIRIDEHVDPMALFLRLKCAMGPDDFIFIDVTASTHWASEAFIVDGPRRYFSPSNNQSMGWAIPAAIGAQRIHPDRRVVSVSGDGCFLMSGLEMSTAARMYLPTRFFVLDDGAYHYMQMLQEPAYRRTTATELAQIDFEAFARAMGIGYNEILCNQDLDAGIARAFSYPGAVLTRVVVGYEGRKIRWLEAVKNSYIDHASTARKAKMASRVVARSVVRPRKND